MAEIDYSLVRHAHQEFLAKAAKQPGFRQAYDALEIEYALAREMLAARAPAGLTQEAVAASMGTTKSAVCRLEAANRHVPSVASEKKYAEALGCRLKIELVPQPAKRRAA